MGILAFAGKVADHNDRAMSAVPVLATAIGHRLGVVPYFVGKPRAATNSGWKLELADAMAELKELSAHLEKQFLNDVRPLLVLSRNAAALATLPVVADRRPDAALIWVGADASLNTPATTRTGYLGGMVLTAVTGLWHSGLGAGVALSRIALAGTRDIEPTERYLTDSGAVGLIHASAQPIEHLRQFITGRPIFVHVSCDVLEPGIVPTDYKVPGGLSLHQLKQLAHILAEHDVVGVEIAELEEPAQPTGSHPSEVIADALWPLISACRNPQL
ncbi:arginase family protein [Leifsonia sp. SIMBA_070]|uniref:arginase family protein n=1 Tax=Leifsonia sp. SIMBA_070 TaxID=3085810 RepID=UPI0039791A53